MHEKDQSLPNKNNQTKNSSRKPRLFSYSNSRLQSPSSNKSHGRSLDRQTHNMIQKKTAEQIFRIINTETVIPDQTLLEVITLTIIRTAHIQTLETDFILTIIQKFFQKTAIEINQTILTEIIPTDYKIFRTTDHIIRVITTDLEQILEIETIVIKIDQETILNHRFEITHNVQIDRVKFIEVVCLNIKDKTIKYKLHT